MKLPTAFSSTSRATRALIAGAAAMAVALPVADAASAKTKTAYHAKLTDERGDAKPAGRDLVRGTVSYNRKSGVLSAKVVVAGNYTSVRRDAAVLVSVSDSTAANCSRVTMTIGVQLSNPSVAMAWRGANPGKQRWYGTGRVRARTLTMRVKHKRLAGRAPRCAAAYITTTANAPAIIDDTPIQRTFS